MKKRTITTVTLRPLLLSREQAAQVLGGIDVSTLDRLERRGAIGPRPITLGSKGGRVFYTRHELERWCELGCPGRIAWDRLEAERINHPDGPTGTEPRKGRSRRGLRGRDQDAMPRMAG